MWGIILAHKKLGFRCIPLPSEPFLPPGKKYEYVAPQPIDRYEVDPFPNHLTPVVAYGKKRHGSTFSSESTGVPSDRGRERETFTLQIKH